MKKLLIVGFAVFAAVLNGVAGESPIRVSDGEVVVSSPFDLMVGSAEYAKELSGYFFESPVTSYRDGDRSRPITNRAYSVSARLEPAVWDFTTITLQFDGEKRFSGFRLFGETMNPRLSLDECQRIVAEIAADLEKRYDVELSGEDDDVEEVRARLAESLEREDDREKEIRARIMESMKSKGVKDVEKVLRHGIGCSSRHAEIELGGQLMNLSVQGTFWNTGKCDVGVHLMKSHNPDVCERRSPDHVTVYTNSPSASARTALLLSDEQKKAHEKSAGLRAALVRLFGVDLDKPELTVDLSAIDLKAKTGPEWTKLESPVAGMTERKLNMNVSVSVIPMGTFAVRHVFEGVASEADREAVAKAFLAALEKEAGEPVPAKDAPSAGEGLAKLFGQAEGVPAFGDTRAAFRLDTRRHFFGQVGDLVITIESAPPRYVQKNGGYEVSVRGAVVVTVLQSPFVANMK